MTENNTTNSNPDHDLNQAVETLPPPEKKKGKWRPALIWLIPFIALLIALSLAIKSILAIGPTIHVSFRTAEGLVAGKTTVKYRQVDIGLVREIVLSDDRSHVIAKIELRKDASNFAAKDSRFWVVRPRVGTSGVSGIDTLFSGSYIEVDGGKSDEKKEDFNGLEVPPVVTSDVPGKRFFLKAKDLGSLDIGSPIYYRRINVGQITAYNLANDGKYVELQTFIRSPYDKFVTQDARFWQASGVDVTLNASGFNLDTQSLASIVAGGIAFGYPENSNAQIAQNLSHFNLWDSKAEALKDPDGKPISVEMYFDQSLRGLTAGAPIDFMGIEVGNIKSINAEFDRNYSRVRMRAEGTIYPSRLAHGQDMDPNGEIFKRFVQNGWRAQMRTGNLLTGQNYIAFDLFPKAKPAFIKVLQSGTFEVPTMPSELKGLQAQVSQIADKLTKFPLVEIGQDMRKTLGNMNTAIDSTNQLVQQLDGKVAPELQSTLNDVRGTLRSTESILSSDAPLQRDVRRALQQMTRAAASLQLMSDYIEQHPESLIRGKTPEVDRNEK
ncbi:MULTISPECIES: intermembrane transport protein PqiB [unclassified Acinetobacter]|uniref:PqiB family protein n=1 Tax=unclassified Acinetobacter TaxID=196816 RepID=UPI00190BD1F4|nr:MULTISPECIES: MlaD family protein [unclassified Acinetobacter]MBK0063137.1 MCE family protein [Acinetobacter sp. S55]MBK0066445.1 MCE family protein [Acinetobacter sp. S54]